VQGPYIGIAGDRIKAPKVRVIGRSDEIERFYPVKRVIDHFVATLIEPDHKSELAWKPAHTAKN
jgi:hypothetical protein